MKKTNAHRGLHLVAAETQTAGQQPSAGAEPDMDSSLQNGILRYQELQLAFDRELFGNQDLEKIGEILPELQLLRKRLERHGIHV